MVPSSDGPEKLQRHEARSGSNGLGENSSSTKRWNDVPRGTMDEVSSHVRWDLPSGKVAPKIVPLPSSDPMTEGPGADSEEKRVLASDLDTVMVDSLKALDLSRPIREADISSDPSGVTSGTIRDRGRSVRPFLGQSLLRRWLDIVQRKLSRQSVAAFIAGLYRGCS